MGLETLRAKWIIPVDGRPIEGGSVSLQGGRILAVGEDVRTDTVDLGEVAIVPGFVNAHTHLEFSALPAPLSPGLPFTDWLKRVIQYRREHPSVVRDAIQAGLKESVAGGTTLIGDIATSGWTPQDYEGAASKGPRVVVFQELLGLSPERIAPLCALAETHLGDDPAGPIARRMLSPHAPYSVHPQVLDHAISLTAPQRGRTLAMHLAETASERELLETGGGEFRDFLQDMGVWQPDLFGGRSYGDILESLGDLPRGLIVHGNDLRDKELMRLAQFPHLTTVYCPRTHAAFGHPPHPWLTLLSLGGTVAIGTDSRASNPDLSMWNELQFLAERFPDVPHHTLLKLGTWAGATALGLRSDCGSLTPGKRADFAIIELRDPAFRDPNFDLFAPGNRVIGTMIGGEWAVDPTTR
ncbi:MAG: amidohydrolase family protein [Planctomycetaceae bacterium]|nr:amidohydrolase family protein [Planctomycetaceae bacterium]